MSQILTMPPNKSLQQTKAGRSFPKEPLRRRSPLGYHRPSQLNAEAFGRRIGDVPSAVPRSDLVNDTMAAGAYADASSRGNFAAATLSRLTVLASRWLMYTTCRRPIHDLIGKLTELNPHPPAMERSAAQQAAVADTASRRG